MTSLPDGVVIRPLAVADDDEVHDLYLTTSEALLHDNPDRPMWSEDVLTGMIRYPDPDAELQMWVAVEASPSAGPRPRVLGIGYMALPLSDNRHMAIGGVAVRPAESRRGVGGALVEQLVDTARDRGRAVFLSDAVYGFADRDGHGYRRFAERHGFTVASVEVTRQLQLPVPEERLKAWMDDAAAHHAAYRVETFDEIPEELLQGVCDVENTLIVDAPSGEIEFEARQRTPGARRAASERDRANGVTTFETLAIHHDGQVAAVTTLQVADGEDDRVRQVGTIVHRAHRGHRLGMAVKAANLLAMQRAFPERRVVHTSNHEDNATMVAINELMGFTAQELHVQFIRELEPTVRAGG